MVGHAISDHWCAEVVIDAMEMAFSDVIAGTIKVSKTSARSRNFESLIMTERLYELIL